MHFQSITGWHDHILAGREYLATACNGQARPAVFNNALIFQLAAMAIEKLIVGVCQYHQQMPTDHTLSGLVQSLEPVCPLDTELAGRIKRIEQLEDMCALKPVQAQLTGDAEIREILEIGHQVACFAGQHIPGDKLEGAAA